MAAPVCSIMWAGQPDLQFLCDESWSTPKWGSEQDKATGLEGVHKADTDRLYTFEDEKVTCEKCRSLMKTGW